MTTRFTRLSIVAGTQQIDVSLPAARPVADFVAELPSLFGLPPNDPPAAWALSTSRQGAVASQQTLDDAGIVDGDLLYLSPSGDAAEAPVVDDVLSLVGASVDELSHPWEGTARDWAVTGLLAAGLLPLAVVIALVRRPTVAGVLFLAAFFLAVAVARILRSRGGPVLGWVAVGIPPVAGLELLRTSEVGVRTVAAFAATVAGVAVVAVAIGLTKAVSAAGVTTAILAGGTAALLTAGVDATALAAWATIGFVLALGLLPQLSLALSGLVGIVRTAEGGAPARRHAVLRSVRTGRWFTDGVVAGLGVAGAAAAATLVVAGRPAQAWLGGLVALIFLLRSRGFSQAPQVGFLLLVPVGAAVAAVIAAPRWAGVDSESLRSGLWIGGIVVVLVVTAVLGFTRLPEVAAARVSRLTDRIDMFATLALIPVVLVAQRVFTWLAHKV